MKYGQIIKPEDVPSLVRSGDLRFGMELEFSIYTSGVEWTEPRPFIGLDTTRLSSDRFVTHGGWYYAARFPRPALKDGDPVVVTDTHRGDKRVVFRAFEFGSDKKSILCYHDKTCKWTSSGFDAVHRAWRLPTKKELHDAGLDGWYDGRIELEEG